MNIKMISLSFIAAILLGGCGTTSSSSVPYVPYSEQTNGAIFVTDKGLPIDIKFKVIGIVKANAREDYNSVESLYPLIVQEARQIGANAIIEVYGGRALTATSWSAPFTGGTAVKVSDPEALIDLKGRFYKLGEAPYIVN